MESDRNNPDNLNLENQLCFALYVCSKEIIRLYKPILEPMGLTYTAYIVMMALWQQDGIPVKELGKMIYLDSGTLTPLLKKMEKDGLISRNRNTEDERSIKIFLTQKGTDLKQVCLDNPEKLICAAKLQDIDGKPLMESLHKIISSLQQET